MSSQSIELSAEQAQAMLRTITLKKADERSSGPEAVLARVKSEITPKLHFLFEPHPYKVSWSGRYATKSWSYADALLALGIQRPLRILCARETMRSIADSVHKLLCDQIIRLGLGRHYQTTQSSIRGTSNGTEVFYAGLRNNIGNIKSIEGCDIVWVEEAQVVSRNSWETLIPTIRKAGSEIWVSLNPELSTDDSYVRWIINPPPGAVVVKLSWRDNRWITPDMQAKMDYLRDKDPDAYEHIYEGSTKSTVQDAVYKAELLKCEKDGRICRVPYSAMIPVDTYWDLGYGDMVSIWFVQATPFEFRLIDYYENTHQAIDFYLQVLQSKGYTYGTCVFPWDGGAKSLGTGRSIADMTKAKGFKVIVNRQSLVHDGINAVRTIFPQLFFDGERCADGLAALRRYQWGPPSADGRTKREPIHDLNSHPADALRSLAMRIKVPAAITPPSAPTQPARRSGGSMAGFR